MRDRHVGRTGYLATAAGLAVLLASASAPGQTTSSTAEGDDRATGSWLSFAVDQMAVDQLELADMQIKSGKFVEAAETLQSILDAPDQWLSTGTSGSEFVGAHEAVNRRIAGLPVEGRAAYERLAESIAQALLDQALGAQDVDKLREAAERFGHTPSGRRARSAFAAFLRDRGWTKTADAADGKPNDSEREAPVESAAVPDASQLRKVAIDVPDWTRRHVQSALDEAFENGRRPLLSVEAVRTTSGLVFSTPFGTAAVGEGRWSKDSPLAQPVQASHEPGDLQERFFQNARLTSLATDGDRVYQLVEGRSSRTEQQQRGDEVLLCLNQDGTEAWQLDPFSLEVRFLSPPTVGLDRVWVLAESRTAPHLDLMAIDPFHGDVLSRNNLGEALRSWEQDVPRQRHAARIVIDRDAVLCLTAAGAVVAVEPLTGERLWAYRYPRSDAPQQPREPGQPMVESVEWSVPRRAHVAASPERLALVSPDTDAIHVLDRATGRPVRQLPSLPADRLLRMTGDELLIEAVDSIRTVDVSSGDVTWSANLNWPAARGALAGGLYVYPAVDGTLRTVAPGSDDPKRQAERRLHEVDGSGRLLPRRPSELVALLRVGDEWFFLSAAAEEGSSPPQDKRASSTNSLSVLEALVEQLESSLAASEWKEAAVAWSRLMEQNPAVWFLELPGQRQTCRLDRWIQGRLRESRARLTAADLAQFDQVFAAEYRRLVDADVKLPLELWDRCGEFPWVWEDRVGRELPACSVGELLGAELQLLRQSRLADGRLKAAAMFRLAQLHFGRAQWKSAAYWLSKLRGATDRDWIDAISPKALGGAAVTELQRKVDEQLAFLPTWPEEAVPVMAQQERLSTDIIRTPVPIAADPSEPWQRITAELGWPGGRELYLTRADWPQPELVRLPAAQNAYRTDSSMIRAWTVGDLIVLQAGAEVFGVASHTAGGTPEGSVLWVRDSPAATRSASHNGDDLNDVSSIEAGFRRSHENAVTRNLYGLPAGILGPVGPGWALLRQQGMLVGLDPATGTELWRRCGLPAECSLFADERFVVVIASSPLEGRVVEVLRGADGGLERRAKATFDPSAILQAVGTRLLLHSRPAHDGPQTSAIQKIVDSEPAPLSLEFVDLIRQDVVWRREWGAGALAFEVDGARFGVARPEGQLEFVDLETGQTLNTVEASLPSPMRTAACTVTDDALLIAVAGPKGDRLLPRGYDRNSARRIDLSGQLIACDLSGEKVRWEHELKDTSWPLDQPPHLPVIVISEAHSQGDYAPMSSRLRVLDKRTGEQLLQEEQSNRALMNVVVTGQLARRVVRLRTQYRIIEFRYQVRHHP